MKRGFEEDSNSYYEYAAKLLKSIDFATTIENYSYCECEYKNYHMTVSDFEGIIIEMIKIILDDRKDISLIDINEAKDRAVLHFSQCEFTVDYRNNSNYDCSLYIYKKEL